MQKKKNTCEFEGICNVFCIQNDQEIFKQVVYNFRNGFCKLVGNFGGDTEGGSFETVTEKKEIENEQEEKTEQMCDYRKGFETGPCAFDHLALMTNEYANNVQIVTRVRTRYERSVKTE